MTIVKICGLTTYDDACAAADAGADLLGFIFYPKSPRYVAPEAVRTIVAALRADAEARDQAFSHNQSLPPSPRLPRMVGVFVNTPVAEVRELLEICMLDYAQLHGDEPVADLAALDLRAYKAIRPAQVDQALADAARLGAGAGRHGPRLLVDAFNPNAYGGTGQRGDWDLAARVAAATPRMLLAGGLSAENVADAVRAVNPWGVDVSSGVEASPGRKDQAAVRRFIANAKAALIAPTPSITD